MGKDFGEVRTHTHAKFESRARVLPMRTREPGSLRASDHSPCVRQRGAAATGLGGLRYAARADALIAN
eukprot:6737957-Prymnesium_polylepis.1